MPDSHDKTIIRELAQRVADIAALPVQRETETLWRKLNGLKPDRPMVMIDQVCWNEMNEDDALTLRCQDPECRGYEDQLRKTLFRWDNFRADMIVEPSIKVAKAVHSSGFGITTQSETAVSDPTNSVVGHHFNNQFENDADLDKIKTPVITHHADETERRLSVAHDLFDGILEVVEDGYNPAYMSVWDPISFWMSVEGALYALIDRPDFITEMVRRVVNGYMSMLDQLESQGLICRPQSLIHCTGAWTDDLPSQGYDPTRPRTTDVWMFSMAQMFSTVSPEMHDEFEIQPCMPLFKRFGRVYYGCCEPLEKKMAQVRNIPNLRKVSMSPWVDEELGASEIGGQFVYSRKPNPALLAWPRFDEQAVRDHLQTSVDICKRHGCPLELILKDISTVNYEPRRLFEWARIAMEIVQD